MNNSKKSFWEGFIVVVIIIAIIELFLEDLSRLFLWSVSIRTTLVISGFWLDLIFSIEFVIRSINSKRRKGWLNYFKYEKGWVDLFSSLPLLLFNSGPIMIGMFWPGALISLPFLGFLNILKITKILRIARILRMLRVLKIFKSSNIKSEQQREVQLSRIISIAIVTISFILIISPFFPAIFYSMENDLKLKTEKYVNILQDWYFNFQKRNEVRINFLNQLLTEDKDVLYMYFMGRTVVNNIDTNSPVNYLTKNFFYTDYKVLNFMSFKLYYSVRDVIKNNARVNLLLETIIIGLIFGFLLFYKS